MNKLSAVVIALMLSNFAFSQMDCRSNLGAHLTPFHKNVPILWAIEGTMAPGIMTSPYNQTDITKLNGGMVIAALDFTFLKKNNLYFEGGYKNWKTSDFVNEIGTHSSKNFGMRQAFYFFNTTNTKIKVGLHETKLGSFPLVDERILGISVDENIGAFSFNFRGGTVMKNFARMGVFCSNRHLYGIISPNYTENIGKKPGDTNLAGIAINWNPQYEKPSIDNANADEFSEFSDESNLNEAKSNNFQITNVQLLLYDEFGSDNFIPENKMYAGSFIDMNFPYGVTLLAGGVYQNLSNNNTLIYLGNLGKIFSWQDGSNTKLSAGYIGKIDFSTGALYQPIFSNLFLGEIMRLDVADFPLWTASVNHRFPGKLKFDIAVKAVGQINGWNTNEQDLEFGILTFKNHLKVTVIGSRVQTSLTPEDFYMVRTELRLAF
ncbi:MAG: hypothetical protein PHE56_02165 [Bacteroidales bacterium]|jgi:hypothetical protein|nr:hypothetical protein [Bacteroidales bacterium]